MCSIERYLTVDNNLIAFGMANFICIINKFVYDNGYIYNPIIMTGFIS